MRGPFFLRLMTMCSYKRLARFLCVARLPEVVLAIAVLGSAMTLAAQTLTFNVPTTQTWTDTGVDLHSGEAVLITASPASSNGCDPVGVAGSSAGGTLPNSNGAPGVMIARLEANGPAWVVGASREFHMTSTGHLWLGVNSDGSGPCKGTFAAKVQMGADATAATAASSAATPAGAEALTGAAKSNAGTATTSNSTGSNSASAPNDQVKDVKGALETAAQTWLSGQFGTGNNSGGAPGSTGSAATGSSGSNSGVPALSIPADKISKAPLDAQFRKDIDGLPRRVNDQFKNLGDMVNFVIVGNQVKVADALTAADWHIADRDVKESVLKAALETYEKKAYLTMPMSDLYLYGRIQDYGYEQAEPYAVVASRHHFRIWKAPFTWNAQEVWVGAGTHDIGFEKDQRNGNVTHKIDPNVDGERDNIGATLEKSGKVKSLTYYLPPNPVQDSRNATGGGYHSDGRILVIQLN